MAVTSADYERVTTPARLALIAELAGQFGPNGGLLLPTVLTPSGRAEARALLDRVYARCSSAAHLPAAGGFDDASQAELDRWVVAWLLLDALLR